MPTINGDDVASTFVGFRTNIPSGCLYTVWQAAKANGARSDTTYPNALAAFYASSPWSAQKTKNPPRGAMVWLGVRNHKTGKNDAAGDVFVSLGDGRCAATDFRTWGNIGVCTIDERVDQTDRPFLGWTLNLLGNAIAVEETAGGDAEPFPTPSPDPAEQGDIDMRTLYITDDPNPDTNHVVLGELTFRVQGTHSAARENDAWPQISCTKAQRDEFLAELNARRNQANLAPLKGVRGE